MPTTKHSSTGVSTSVTGVVFREIGGFIEIEFDFLSFTSVGWSYQTSWDYDYIYYGYQGYSFTGGVVIASSVASADQCMPYVRTNPAYQAVAYDSNTKQCLGLSTSASLTLVVSSTSIVFVKFSFSSYSGYMVGTGSTLVSSVSTQSDCLLYFNHNTNVAAISFDSTKKQCYALTSSQISLVRAEMTTITYVRSFYKAAYNMRLNSAASVIGIKTEAACLRLLTSGRYTAVAFDHHNFECCGLPTGSSLAVVSGSGWIAYQQTSNPNIIFVESTVTPHPTAPTTHAASTTTKPTVATTKPTVATTKPTVATTKPTVATTTTHATPTTTKPTVATTKPTVDTTTTHATPTTTKPTVATTPTTTATTKPPTTTTKPPTTTTKPPTTTTKPPTTTTKPQTTAARAGTNNNGGQVNIGVQTEIFTETFTQTFTQETEESMAFFIDGPGASFTVEQAACSNVHQQGITSCKLAEFVTSWDNEAFGQTAPEVITPGQSYWVGAQLKGSSYSWIQNGGSVPSALWCSGHPATAAAGSCVKHHCASASNCCLQTTSCTEVNSFLCQCT